MCLVKNATKLAAQTTTALTVPSMWSTPGRSGHHQRLRRHLLHELEVPQPLLLLLGRRPLNRHLLLQIKNTPKISTSRNRTNLKRTCKK